MNVRRIFILLTGAMVAAAAMLPDACGGFTRPCLYVEGILGAAILLCMVLYSRVVKPLHVANMGIDLLREQDYGSRLAPVGQKDADRIVELFNDLMDNLKTERLRTLETDHLLSLLIEASPTGIISIGNNDRIILCNSASCTILGEDPIGKRLDELSSQVARECSMLEKDESRVVRLTDTKIYRCSRLSFMDRGMSRPFILIETLTDEVRRAEREAYGKVIRVIGHEVNNSLASISSLLRLLLDTKPWGDDELLTEAVEGSSRRADRLAAFISAYSGVVKIPPLNTTPATTNRLITDLQPFLCSMAYSAGVNVEFDLDADATRQYQMDLSLMEQVIVNIFKNAIESIGDRPDGKITISTGTRGHIIITDNGAGLSTEAQRSLFTPFFSTKPSGQGLGLMFVSEILNRHEATFSLGTSPDDGLTRFTIKLK
ncbi:MAG: PAS domain-containing protein [Muribaculaceae bacterium]|nr:PAS domain-containing protein [Muribaculaceae bacterium]